MKNIFFNAHHAPIGAYASFTLGYKGAKGGLGIEMAKPADQNVFIGLQTSEAKFYKALPFFDIVDKNTNTDNIMQSTAAWDVLPQVVHYGDAEIKRDYRVATDTWYAGNLIFRLYSPVKSIPNPATGSKIDLKMALLPAILAEIEVDNLHGNSQRRVFFGYQGNDPYWGMKRWDDFCNNGIVGIGQGNITAIVSKNSLVKSGLGLSIEEILDNEIEDNRSFMHGGKGLLYADVPAGKSLKLEFAVCFFRAGIVTSGIETGYFYTKLFNNIAEVAEFALANFDLLVRECYQADQTVAKSQLSKEQQFMLSHAIHSYYGSTQLLGLKEEPLWVVNEGEYKMMNTLDLTVDHLFFELKMNPWTVRNVLELFLERYSYYDEVSFPNNSQKYPGGIGFTHDMGAANVFAKPQFSCYELGGLNGCYSYMTHEELVNWLCCATVYIIQTQDFAWYEKHLEVFIACFNSLLNRDHPLSDQRDGIMNLDTSRTKGGTEITTYDCLDASLGQARNNLYVAGKCWAVYLALEKLFLRQELKELSLKAGLQAAKCVATIVKSLTADGFLPAILEDGNQQKIIPAIEGLVYAYFTECKTAFDPEGRYGYYLKALKKHLTKVLVPGICLFADGGWKLSSTSNNSWLSKIYLCQFVARHILGLELTEINLIADQIHADWLLDPELSYWCWSDQVENGQIIGSRYYPRGVTSILWLEEA
jgi:hypothetical protein